LSPGYQRETEAGTDRRRAAGSPPGAVRFYNTSAVRAALLARCVVPWPMTLTSPRS
jgi:hypothetical protein